MASIFVNVIRNFVENVGSFSDDEKSLLDAVFDHKRYYAEIEHYTSHLQELIPLLQSCLGNIASKNVTSENPHSLQKPKDNGNINISKQIEENVLVQIKASNEEIERRINAFMEKKQAEVDDINKREFCNFFKPEPDYESCARTDAIFIPRSDSKSHFRVTKVVNPFGPQTHLLESNQVTKTEKKLDMPKVKDEFSSGSIDFQNSGLEERLHNMETHLQLNSNSNRYKDVFERLKILEERILHLESLSPEYFDLKTSSINKRKIVDSSTKASASSKKYKDFNISDLDGQIMSLKSALKCTQVNL